MYEEFLLSLSAYYNFDVHVAEFMFICAALSGVFSLIITLLFVAAGFGQLFVWCLSFLRPHINRFLEKLRSRR